MSRTSGIHSHSSPPHNVIMSFARRLIFIYHLPHFELFISESSLIILARSSGLIQSLEEMLQKFSRDGHSLRFLAVSALTQ